MAQEKAKCQEEAATLRAELENVKALTQSTQDRALQAESRDALSQQKVRRASRRVVYRDWPNKLHDA